MSSKDLQKEIEAAQRIAGDIFLFVKAMFNLVPQGAKPEYRKKLAYIYSLEGEMFEEGIKLITADWFGTYNPETKLYDWFDFTKGKHLTWQQTLLMMCANKAVQKKIKWRLSISSGHGIGKCLGLDTPILMADGSIKPVQEVEEEDLLMGDDNTPRKVLSLARGREQMYRIRYFSGDFYDVNESHILSLVASQSHGNQKMGDITNVSVRDYLKWSDRKKRTNIGYKRSIELPEQNLLIDPYLLGLWLGDGASRNGIIYNIDHEIIKHLEDIGIEGIRRDTRTNCWQATIVGLYEKLKKEGLLNNKHIPDQYLRSSREQRINLLAGLIDTDGSIDKNKRQFSITQKNKLLAEQIKWLAQSVGMHATLNETMKCATNGSRIKMKYYIINISRNIEIVPVKVERKKPKTSGKQQRSNLHFGFTVEPLGEGDYYGFEIDGNKLFMLGDFTVTHNTSSCAIIILWFLFGRVDSQVACTAPTATQMHDVLWKELALWIGRMPEKIKNLYEHNKDYIRIKERPDSWFARAKTSSKENSEALAGIHAEWVFLLADEASGIEEQIFTVMDGALTSGNFLVMLIGNPTRNSGYFYETHHKNKDAWVNLAFSGIESPIVDKKYEEDQARQHGRDSEQYGIRVLGKFPSEDTMSNDGYVRLLGTKDLNIIPKVQPVTFGSNSILGIDPSGEGDDKTVFTIRNEFKAKVIFKESISNAKYIAEKILTFIDLYNLDASNVVVDAFGIGTTISGEVAKASNGKHIIQSINVGESCDYEDEKEEYINKRALYYHKDLRNWIRTGGQIVEDSELEGEIDTIYYKRNLQGKVQIMPKVEMRKRGYKSPNCLDSLMLTFHRQVIKKDNDEFKDDWEHNITDYDPFNSVF